MKAIVTKFLSATSTKGERIIASDEDGNGKIVSYDYSIDTESNHRVAAEALYDKMGWSEAERLISGSIKRGYVFVQIK